MGHKIPALSPFAALLVVASRGQSESKTFSGHHNCSEGIWCNCAPGVSAHLGLHVLLFQPPAAKGQVGKVRTLVARWSLFWRSKLSCIQSSVFAALYVYCTMYMHMSRYNFQIGTLLSVFLWLRITDVRWVVSFFSMLKKQYSKYDKNRVIVSLAYEVPGTDPKELQEYVQRLKR